MGGLGSTCHHIEIKDHIWCGDKGSIGASCFHDLTGEKSTLTKAEWDDLRFGQICTLDPEGNKGATFADYKYFIETMCSWHKRECTTEVKKKLTEFFFRAKEFQIPMNDPNLRAALISE